MKSSLRNLTATRNRPAAPATDPDAPARLVCGSRNSQTPALTFCRRSKPAAQPAEIKAVWRNGEAEIRTRERRATDREGQKRDLLSGFYGNVTTGCISNEGGRRREEKPTVGRVHRPSGTSVIFANANAIAVQLLQYHTLPREAPARTQTLTTLTLARVNSNPNTSWG